jgi:hypothetical protein
MNLYFKSHCSKCNGLFKKGNQKSKSRFELGYKCNTCDKTPDKTKGKTKNH